jgi:hypothetical protein
MASMELLVTAPAPRYVNTGNAVVGSFAWPVCPCCGLRRPPGPHVGPLTNVCTCKECP